MQTKWAVWTALAAAAILAGCQSSSFDLFRSDPRPTIEIENVRAATVGKYDLTEEGEQYIRQEKVVPGDLVNLNVDWPSDFQGRLTFREQYRTDVPDAEVLAWREWEVATAGNSTEALVWGLKASEMTSQTAIAIANAAATAALAGTPAVAGELARVALEYAREPDTENTTRAEIEAVLGNAGLLNRPAPPLPESQMTDGRTSPTLGQ